MLSVGAAERLLKHNRVYPATAFLPVDKVRGAILAENIRADRDQPACDNAKMDGFAISFRDWKSGTRIFPVTATQRAGQPPKKIKRKKNAVSIFTGAPLPKGFDCVIPIEEVRIANGKIIIPDRPKISRGQNIRHAASEYKKGQVLLQSGTRLLAPQLAVAASVGKTRLRIQTCPRIAIIGTGDELVPVSAKPRAFQSRRSNTITIDASLRQHGFNQNKIFQVKDRKTAINRRINTALTQYDVVVISGGVSMGKFDLVPQVLREVGAKIIFHKIRQRPGKPLLFAKTKDGKIIFGLPGNPVSTLVCLYRYVLPFLQPAAPVKHWVKLASAVPSNSLTLFLPVKINNSGQVKIVAHKGSGDYFHWSKSDGFVEIPAGKKIRCGEMVRFWEW